MPPTQSTTWKRVARFVVWALALSFVLWLLQSALWTSRLPVALRLLVGGIALLGSLSPTAALVAVAFLAPIGHALVTTAWDAYPLALSEALVLAFFAGYLWSGRRRMIGVPPDFDSLALPSTLFALIVLASCFVQFTVLQVWHDYPLNYAASFAQFLRSEYLIAVPDPRAWVDGRGFVLTAAILLEGIALMRCSRRLCAAHPALSRRLAMALVAAGTVAAALSLMGPLGVKSEGNRTFLTLLLSRRWSTPAIPSLDTAGPFFMLLVFIAAGYALGPFSRSWPWILATAAVFGGMWITKTRSAIVAGLAVAAALAVWTAGSRFRRMTPPRIATAAVLVAVTVALTVTFLNPLHILNAGIDTSLRMRVLFAQTGLRMFATAPITGVGIGQYEANYMDFASREILRYDPRVNNAHNYFIWMGAELGVFGLAIFLWFVASAFWQSWLNLRASPIRHRGLLLAGLVAFAITWSIGQPLAIPPMAYTFWMALGMASAPDAGAGGTAASRRRWPVAAQLTVVALVIVVAASMPVRIRRALGDIDLSRVSYGFYNSGVTDDQRQFRWAGPRVTFFMRSSVWAVDLPMAALLSATPNGAQVNVWIDGRAMAPVMLSGQEWRTVRLNPAPASRPAARYWRIDLQVKPIGAAAGAPDEDQRVAVGEIVRLPAPGTS